MVVFPNLLGKNWMHLYNSDGERCFRDGGRKATILALDYYIEY